jgi:predicted Zn-dependent protease
MEKLLFRVIIGIGVFFGVFFGLQQIDWMTLLKVEQTTKSNEEKLGELVWESIEDSEVIIEDATVTTAIDSLITTICKANDIERSKIKVHIIQESEVNAFALPNYHLVIYTGLISESENEAELCGVLGHELAHMQLDHVMKKMVKEIGLATIVSMTAGNGGGQVVMESLKHLTSSAYDRSLEEEADIKAVDYLVNAHIDPEQFANFMYRLGGKSDGMDKYLEWVSTHPNSRERAEDIITYSLTKTDMEFEPILSDESWVELQLGVGY